MAYINRRQFMSRSSAFGFAASMGALTAVTSQRAWAANTSGYKAVVCLFLKGGLDHADSVIHYDQPSYDRLAQERQGLFGAYNANSSASSRNRSNLLKLNPQNSGTLGGLEFAFPPQMSEMHAMFEAGDMAVVGNVGPLLNRVTRSEIESDTANLPARLFSHNDQQSTWMTFSAEGARVGWGGRFADLMAAATPGEDATYKAISTTSNDPFLAGNTVRQFRVTSSGAVIPDLIGQQFFLGSSSADDETRARLAQYLERSNFGSSNYFEQDFANAKSAGFTKAQALLDARQTGSEVTTAFPESRLGKQLKSIVETINIQQSLNTSRQVFYATAGGFDTHSTQTGDLPGLQADISASLAAFRAGLIEIGHWDDTVLFTASDFGRTVIDNGDGTDHGWGGHHFVMGGGVNGRNMYGSFPSPETNSGNYMPTRGRLIPTVSIEQYAATIGSWFGLSDSELATALPNLSEFNDPNLGFLSNSST